MRDRESARAPGSAACRGEHDVARRCPCGNGRGQLAVGIHVERGRRLTAAEGHLRSLSEAGAGNDHGRSCCTSVWSDNANHRVDSEWVIARQRSAGCSYGNGTGRGSAGNRSLQEGVGPNKGCGSSIEGNIGCARESLPENRDRCSDLAGGGYEPDKRAEAEVYAVNIAAVLSPSTVHEAVNLAIGMPYRRAEHKSLPAHIGEIVDDGVVTSRTKPEQYTRTPSSTRYSAAVEVAVAGFKQGCRR